MGEECEEDEEWGEDGAGEGEGALEEGAAGVWDCGEGGRDFDGSREDECAEKEEADCGGGGDERGGDQVGGGDVGEWIEKD